MSYVPTEIDYEGSDADRLPDMGQKVNTNLNDIEAEFAAWMGAGVCGQFAYLATDFVGGTSGCLDNIDATDISDGDKAIIVFGTAPPRLWFYRMKSPDSTTESSPEVIAPDTGGTTKRWMLAGRSERHVKSMGSAPTENDDVNDGYLVGDAWQYSDTIYFCLDNSAGAAVWLYVPSPSGVAAHHANHEDGGSDEITLLKDDIQVAGAIDLLEISTPSNPASGRDKIYPKTGGGIYKLDNTGSEKELIDEDVLDTSTGHDHDGANSKTVDHSDLTNVTSDQHHAKSHTWEGGDHTGTLNESTVTFDNSSGHDHDGSGSTAVDHADLSNVTSDQHHAKSHTWEGGDHTGTLNESSVTFDNSTGHDHDGSNSTQIAHADTTGRTANDHHNEDHASRHIDGAADPIDGDKIEITWTGYVNYAPGTSPSEVDSTDDLTAHLYGIDQAIGGGGTHADSHKDGGSDPIDGDMLEITWTGHTNYTPATNPSEVDSTDDLTAHLYGIDQALGGVASLSDNEPGTVSSSTSGQAGTGTAASRDDHSHDLGTHAHSGAASGGQISHGDLTTVTSDQHHNQSHVLNGGDHTVSGLTTEHVLQATGATSFAFAEFDGDHADIDFTPSNYTPDATPAEAADVDDLAAHLYGIDQAIGSASGAVHDIVGGHAEITSTTVITYVNVESNQITLFNDTVRTLVTLASAPDFDSGTDLDLDSNSIAADSVYDFFIEYSSGTAANLVCKKWTNTTTRAITPEEYGGQVVYDKDTAAGRKRRFLATVATDSSGYFQDAEDKRFLSNLYHTEHRRLRFANPYTSATSDTGVSTSWEQFNGGTSDWKVQFCYHGLNAEGLNVREHLVNMVACVHVAGASSWNCGVAIGYSTSSPIDGTVFYTDAIQGTCIISTLSDEPLAGLRTLYPLQEVESSGATFYFWTDNDSSQFQGTIEG